MINTALRQLVDAATDHAKQCNDDHDHTVAAALLTRSGRTVLGLNAHHFLGGPCGEISALANHAATCPEDPIDAIVAVYGPTGHVISPCGKCRQVLFDTDPAIDCVVRGSNGLEARSVSELLPHAFDWRAMELPQKVFMWEGYESAIRDGSKRQTIRVDDPFHPGPAQLVFEKESGEVITLDANVTSVVATRRRDLTEEHAQQDGFASLADLHEALDMHYPGLEMENCVDVVSFELSKIAGPDPDPRCWVSKRNSI
ncbi:cytidine deaminase [Brevibacterium paucivorans]|uniref:Cytidine deaminase n=1 Tax=Brevibacterium paucivorans TaxID=170994 RepID=A0ABS2SHJ9_9MICO|nr:ASCH domain-containing protein [Brevibacterium paucivorans]MBM7815718.1 cytidine deaminase [Brevibacterium paucivorans]